MTIRDYFDQKKCRALIVGYCGLAGFVVGILLACWVGSSALLIILPSFACFGGTILYLMTWGFRCPRCGGSWHGLVFQFRGISVFRLDPRIHYCPFCGVDIDAKDSLGPAGVPDDLLA